MDWTVNVFVGVGFQMVVTVVPYPHHRVPRQNNGRTTGENELEPFRHLEPAMREIAMQVKSRADAAPEKDHQHDRQIRNLKAVEQTDHAQNLQSDQDEKDEEMNSFVLKHATTS